MRRAAAAFLALVLAAGLSACTAQQVQTSAQPTPEPTASQPVREATFALGYDPAASLHPLTSQSQMNLDLAGLVYEGLYELDRSFQAQPALARSASVSEDGLTWTITLRSGVRFSDGTPLTAEHVVQSLNTARSGTLYAGRLSAVTSVSASEGAVVLTLSSPNGALDALLDIPVVLEQEGGIPLGTGRYRYVRQGDTLLLELNGNYQGEVPYDTIPLRAVSGADERIAAFDSGEVTAVVTDFSSSYALGYSGNYETCDFPTSTMLYVGFRTTSGVCASAQVRQALSMAFDRENVVTSLLAGHGDAACLPISPLHEAYDPEAAAALDHDPEQAASLLAEAGYTRGEDGLLYRGRTPVQLTLIVNNDSTVKQTVADELARCLGELGITVTVDKLPWEQYLSALPAGQWDLYLGEVRMTADFDPTALLTGSLNYAGFVSQTMPGLVSAWRAARGEERDRAAQQLWQEFSRQVPFAPLCFKRGSMLIRWGMVGNVLPTQADPFWNMEQWQITQ